MGKESSIFTQSENIQHEYCCTVVQIGELTSIPNSDFLASTLVNGNTIVIRKDEVKPGDLMLYASIETQLNKDFLSSNNLFEISAYEKNSNKDEIEKLINDGLKQDAQKLCGFFNKRGRVRLIRLRKCPSFGFLFNLETLYKWKPELKDIDIDLSTMIGQDFDTISGELFVKVYVPYQPERHTRTYQKRDKGVKTFDKMVPGEFYKHYDTAQLQRNMNMISPEDSVCISVKLHGTSAIFGNLLCRVPREFNTKWAWLNATLSYLQSFLPECCQGITEKYQDVYSSRNVIKNQYIKFTKFWKRKVYMNDSFYHQDIWGEYNDLIKDYIPEGMTIYGEIVGYLSGSETEMIQGDYDYGCEPGTNKLMIYRITTSLPDKTKYEWNVSEVYEWTMKFIKDHPELESRIHPIDILWNDTMKNLYPEIQVDENWESNVLAAMKVDKRFGMEELEELCKKDVPREGIVLRINNDKVQEAFKLKCIRFLEKEAKSVDAGHVDIEMSQGYGPDWCGYDNQTEHEAGFGV